MRYVPDAAQMKAADQYTIHDLGIPSLKLMERAARSCVDILKEKKVDLSHVCIVCGSGNNGGDGFAIARILAKEGYRVTVVMAGNVSRCTAETLYQMDLLKQTGTKITDQFQTDSYTVVVDAIFGVGLSRKIEGHYKELIEELNRSSGIKFAVDIPSGICADNGMVLGTAFQADITVTFQAEKFGLFLYPGKEYAGEVIVKDIGISEDYFLQNQKVAVVYDENDYQKMLPVRKPDSHKGTYGRLLVIAGSKGMSGAAYMNAVSAYQVGAGLVEVYTVEENRVILQQLLPEAIISTYHEFHEKEILDKLDLADAVCIGSGMGTGELSAKILKTVIFHAKVPCVIDADGLNILSQHMWYLEKKMHSQYIFTPHMKEMSRLTGRDIVTIKNNRKEIIEEFSDQYQVTCVLKDSRTLVKSANERLSINLTGNSAMAKAGSGDVLAGIIAGLLVQTKSCHQAAVLGVYLHGCCGDVARREKGNYSVMARDLINAISTVFQREEGIIDEEIQSNLCASRS